MEDINIRDLNRLKLIQIGTLSLWTMLKKEMQHSRWHPILIFHRLCIWMHICRWHLKECSVICLPLNWVTSSGVCPSLIHHMCIPQQGFLLALKPSAMLSANKSNPRMRFPKGNKACLLTSSQDRILSWWKWWCSCRYCYCSLVGVYVYVAKRTFTHTFEREREVRRAGIQRTLGELGVIRPRKWDMFSIESCSHPPVFKHSIQKQ